MILSLLKILFAILNTAFVATLELIITPFHRTGKLFHALARFWAYGTLKVCGVKVIVEGKENVDFSRSYIYVSNHASQFDIPAVVAGIPDQIRIVYKKELEKIPIFGWGLKYGKTYIGIDRGRGQDAVQSLEDAANKIRNGASVLLFGEGTRSADGKLQQFKRGPFNLAMRAGVPIVPVAINGSYKILPKHSFRIRPGTITLVLSSPINPVENEGKEAELKLRDEVRAAIERNLKE
ncbi:MAG: 1-acyl-sn-glycerol-3-phosphate acyltransferase [Ignavibacteriales bacterium]|nr:1-acyl-sn-glycerol-3-phosphate acyltransferase [Ignavibacteriales bacterium]